MMPTFDFFQELDDDTINGRVQVQAVEVRQLIRFSPLVHCAPSLPPSLSLFVRPGFTALSPSLSLYPHSPSSTAPA
eukprot:1135923-Rhodomonas_salina.1